MEQAESRATVPAGRPSFLATVIVGGVLVGILDGLDAVIFYGITPGVAPERLFQGIARGLIGPRSFQGGWATALLGLGLHLLISFGAAAAYYLLALKLTLLVRRPWLSGTIFGLAFYAFMYRVVIPLSALPPRPPGIPWAAVIDEIFAHIFLVGLPVSLLAARSARSANS